jgi:hypothetical protein
MVAASNLDQEEDLDSLRQTHIIRELANFDTVNYINFTFIVAVIIVVSIAIHVISSVTPPFLSAS